MLLIPGNWYGCVETRLFERNLGIMPYWLLITRGILTIIFSVLVFRKEIFYWSAYHWQCLFYNPNSKISVVYLSCTYFWFFFLLCINIMLPLPLPFGQF